MDPSRDPHFFVLIEPQILEDAKLEIPSLFVKKHRRRFPKYACLQVPTGAMWKVELKKDNGRVWLDKGWQAFVEKCAIKSGDLLSFKYEGGSFFQVVICNMMTGLEIVYPTDSRANCDRPNVVNIKEEDSDGDSSVMILNEWPHPTKEASVANLSGNDEVLHHEDLPGSSARDRVLQRARAFRSKISNPHFFIIMPPMRHSHVYVPSDAIRYFLGRDDDDDIYLNGPDEKAWLVKYCIEGPQMCQVRLDSGWSEFAEKYLLQDGDVCIFDLFNERFMAFNVTIFHISEEEEEVNRNDHVETHDAPEPETVVMHDVPEPHTPEMPNVPEPPIAESSQHKNPSFTVVYEVNPHTLYTLGVPPAHASRYLSDQHLKEVFLIGLDGKPWTLKCYARRSNVRLQSGWKDFVVANALQEGDILVFELLSQAPNCYNVTIRRAA